jgi:hypothetical protein
VLAHATSSSAAAVGIKTCFSLAKESRTVTKGETASQNVSEAEGNFKRLVVAKATRATRHASSRILLPAHTAPHPQREPPMHHPSWLFKSGVTASAAAPAPRATARRRPCVVVLVACGPLLPVRLVTGRGYFVYGL